MRKRFTAKSLVMQPKFRPMVEQDKKRKAKEKWEEELDEVQATQEKEIQEDDQIQET